MNAYPANAKVVILHPGISVFTVVLFLKMSKNSWVMRTVNGRKPRRARCSSHTQQSVLIRLYGKGTFSFNWLLRIHSLHVPWLTGLVSYCPIFLNNYFCCVCVVSVMFYVMLWKWQFHWDSPIVIVTHVAQRSTQQNCIYALLHALRQPNRCSEGNSGTRHGGGRGERWWITPPIRLTVSDIEPETLELYSPLHIN